MRDEAIVLLAVVSSIIGPSTNVARAHPDLHRILEASSPLSSTIMTACYRPELRVEYPKPPDLRNEVPVTIHCSSVPGLIPERITHSAALDHPVQWSDWVSDRGRSASIAAPRMIIWHVCGVPSNGSALSSYSISEKPARSAQEPPPQEDVRSDECVDDEEGAPSSRASSHQAQDN
jgi:hypothetical protein